MAIWFHSGFISHLTFLQSIFFYCERVIYTLSLWIIDLCHQLDDGSCLSGCLGSQPCSNLLFLDWREKLIQMCVWSGYQALCKTAHTLSLARPSNNALNFFSKMHLCFLMRWRGTWAIRFFNCQTHFKNDERVLWSVAPSVREIR